MRWLYRNCLRPVLFRQDPETIHQRTLAVLHRASRSPLWLSCLGDLFAAPALPVEVFGLRFPNPIGLAAGMDKSAEAVPAWAALGFGFSELGAVTRYGQPGNERPRIFRLISEEAIINRMGFNNPGAETVAHHLAEWRRSGTWPRHPVGVNLGKSKIVPLAEAAEDYAATFRTLWPHADFFVVNVSSPNTPNLRQLQDAPALDAILVELQRVNHQMAAQFAALTPPQSHGPADGPSSGLAHSGVASSRSVQPKPVLVKIAPDLSNEAIKEIVALAGARALAGLVATNTTLARPTVAEPRAQRVYAEAGGLSGRPLRARSTEIIGHLYRQTQGRIPIIGVGGIFSADDAWEKITAGASLLQIYTSLVFEGPSAVKALVQGLRARMEAAGLSQLAQAVGREALNR